MIAIPFFRASAFADQPFEGNPAGVCITEIPLAERTMAEIARENGLSETAFLVGNGTRYTLRWFSPVREVDLCGHATLASAHVVGAHVVPGAHRVDFDAPRIGPLLVVLEAGRWWMTFGVLSHSPCKAPPGLASALGTVVVETHISRFLLTVLRSEEDVRRLSPDLAWIERQPTLGLVATAQSTRPGVDFVSRYFVPQVGIDEDPVSGGTHCVLAPFWARKLGRSSLIAEQASARGGRLFCEVRGQSVRIGGTAITYLRGEILMPEAEGARLTR